MSVQVSQSEEKVHALWNFN